MESPVIAPTVTKLPDGARDAVLLTGSHGGRYAAAVALQAGVRAAVFHDAGIGLDGAGVGGLALFEVHGVPACAVGHDTARIGDAADMLARGKISRVNAPAAKLGVQPGQPASRALALLAAAKPHRAAAPTMNESRLAHPVPGGVRPVVLVDSASLVDPQRDPGAVVVTGSHGGLIGGDPHLALRADGFGAVFNDAGIGIDQAGLGRLPALDARGIAAITVSAATARIGEGQSTLNGTVSAVNQRAAALGARVGQPARAVIEAWARTT